MYPTAPSRSITDDDRDLGTRGGKQQRRRHLAAPWNVGRRAHTHTKPNSHTRVGLMREMLRTRTHATRCQPQRDKTTRSSTLSDVLSNDDRKGVWESGPLHGDHSDAGVGQGARGFSLVSGGGKGKVFNFASLNSSSALKITTPLAQSQGLLARWRNAGVTHG
jgi:hypothetical protein